MNIVLTRTAGFLSSSKIEYHPHSGLQSLGLTISQAVDARPNLLRKFQRIKGKKDKQQHKDIDSLK